jgi:hypothetical protein
MIVYKHVKLWLKLLYNFIVLYNFFLMVYLIAKFRFWKLFIKCFHCVT